MQEYRLSQIREMYLNFFEVKGHLKLESASLIPHNDESLLLINSGMAQFKPYFSGQEVPPSKRLVTCQKCIRTNDIENVGKTSRHATFFEMLGNFSFGDYFKFEAITWAWEFLTKTLKLPHEKLYVTIYQDDDEAFDIWYNKIGLEEAKIFRMDKKDNFWEIGVGPCGPCSEIYFDRGKEYGCGYEECQPGCECDRFIEIWNLVFTQFNRNADGSYSKLMHCNIDTGMGLERIAAVMQNVDSIFDIDSAKFIRNKVCLTAKINYGENKKSDISVRIITDHIKAITFMIGDDIFPSNEGRGYILRRFIRRAICHGKILGIKENFLCTLAEHVIQIFSDAYENLEVKQVQILKTISKEEEKFSDTLSAGLNMINKIISELKIEMENVISGKTVFKLYDTFGFPFEITKEIANESGLKINEDEFKMELENQKQRARKAQRNLNENSFSIQLQNKIKKLSDTKFIGYNTNQVDDAKILAVIYDDLLKEKIDLQEEFSIILDKTPFFAESAGQVSDSGILKTETGTVKITDCQKILGNKYKHKGKLLGGSIEIGQSACLQVDTKKRLEIARNHTATHLLHEVLREKIDANVKQMGSYLDENRLRFDFLCTHTLSKIDLERIEDAVNEKIFDCLDVSISEKNIDEALQSGATALFDEKYGKIVRVVNISDYSIELCSGIHLKNTSQAIIFKIISEGSISSGIRRIVAVTGQAALNYYKHLEKNIERACLILKTDEKNLINRIESYHKENQCVNKELKNLRLSLANELAKKISSNKQIINGANVIIHTEKNSDMSFMQLISDKIKENFDSCLIFLLNDCEGKINLIASSTSDLNLHVGNIIKNVAKKFGGKGGGKKNYAQAGGISSNNIELIINELKANII